MITPLSKAICTRQGSNLQPYDPKSYTPGRAGHLRAFARALPFTVIIIMVRQSPRVLRQSVSRRRRCNRYVTRLDDLLQEAGFDANLLLGFAEALAEDQNFS